MAKKLLIQQSTNGEWMLRMIQTTRHATKAEAVAAKKEEAIAAFVEDEIFDLESGLVEEFGITKEQARQAIRDFVN